MNIRQHQAARLKVGSPESLISLHWPWVRQAPRAWGAWGASRRLNATRASKDIEAALADFRNSRKAARIAGLPWRPVMNVKDVMTPHVVSVAPEESVLVAARLMLQKKISGLPVVDDLGNLVGVVTEGDFLRRAEIGTERRRPKWVEFFVGPGRLADEYVQFSGRKVRDVMTHDVRTVTVEAPLEEVVRLMERHHIKRVPVVEGGKIVGIVTRANLLHAMASFVHEVAPSSVEDTAIREQLLAELKAQPWALVGAIDVAVRNGVVQFSGTVTEERQRQALRVAAENIPGVKKVEDYIILVPIFEVPH
jgi:CBS domain-containing protein